MAYSVADIPSWDLPAQLAEFTADVESSSAGGTSTFVAGPQIALVEAWLHGPVAAELALQTTRPDARDPTIAAVTHFVRGILAAETGDSARGERNGGVLSHLLRSSGVVVQYRLQLLGGAD
jgi:hypothetical protein